MKKSELIVLLEALEHDDDVIIDVGRFNDSNWKMVEDVDYHYVNDKRVIEIR